MTKKLISLLDFISDCEFQTTFNNLNGEGTQYVMDIVLKMDLDVDVDLSDI